MISGPDIRRIRFTPASPRDRRTGLLGWVTFDYAGLRFDGVAVRRTRAHRLVLSFPNHHDRAGRQFPPVRPVDARARAEIEWAVLDAIGLVDADTGATAGHGGRER